LFHILDDFGWIPEKSNSNCNFKNEKRQNCLLLFQFFKAFYLDFSKFNHYIFQPVLKALTSKIQNKSLIFVINSIKLTAL